MTWLICVGAFYNYLNQASTRSIGDHIPGWAVVFLAAVLSPVAIPLVHLFAMLGKWTGSKLGGVASRDQVLAAFAWSGVPMTAWSFFAWPVQLMMFGTEVFRSTTPSMDATNPVVAAALVLVGVIALIWSSVVGIQCFAEVHRFSAWRAIGASLLAIGVVLGPLVGIVLLVAILATVID